MGTILQDLRAALDSLQPGTLEGALVFLALHLAVGAAMSFVVVRTIRTLLAYDAYIRVDRLAAAFTAQLARVFVWLVVLTGYAHLIPALNHLATTLLASVSIASVVVGLAAQSTLANLIAGVSLVFYKPFLLGDRLQIATPTGVETGAVENMSLGYTTLRTRDDRRIVISNSSILNQVMLNLGPVGSRARVSMPFTIKPAADIERARALVCDLAQANPEVEGVVSCLVRDVGSSGTDMVLTVWVGDAATTDRVRSQLLEGISTTLMANDLDVASF